MAQQIDHRSRGFLFSGVRVSGRGVLASGPLASPPERVDVSFPLELSVPLMKYTLFIEDGGWTGKGSFLFSISIG